MRKLIVFILAVIAAAGCWLLFQKYRLEGLGGVRITPRDETEQIEPAWSAPPVNRQSDTIRVASFNVQVFGASKASKPSVMEMLARIMRQFDVVAVQEICSAEQDIVPRLVDRINATGRKYDYVIGPRLPRSGPAEVQEQYAFIFDMASLEIDRNQLYTVDDPDDLLLREPLVGWFRVRGPPETEAFTFTLVNIHTDRSRAAEEIGLLDDVFRKVYDDGRNEDDVILLGTIGADPRRLGPLGEIPGITCAVSREATDVQQTGACDNLFFDRRATKEFIGRAGVYDFLREFNMTSDEALEVSDHFPVWAEFSIYEGGQPGRVARRPGKKVR